MYKIATFVITFIWADPSILLKPSALAHTGSESYRLVGLSVSAPLRRSPWSPFQVPSAKDLTFV